VLVLIAGWIVGSVLAEIQRGRWEERESVAIKRQAITLLSQVRTLESCKKVIDRGTWLQMRDGSWIAIWYHDHHDYWSRSLALDSGGKWYESDKHFCALFEGYRAEEQLRAAKLEVCRQENLPVPDYLKDEPRHGPPLSLIEECPDLPRAIPQLLALGFTPMPPPPPSAPAPSPLHK
jgi:hypothetical protein